jgi:hypothetical protein
MSWRTLDGRPRPGCPQCDSGWIYVNDHTVIVDDDKRPRYEYRYEQVTACPSCLPQHVTTQRDNEPDRKDLQ